MGFGLALFTLGSLSLTVAWQAMTHLRLLKGRTLPTGTGTLPPISVLKPIKGVSPGLWDNLRAFTLQEYPEFELIIGIQSSSDPAVRLVKAFIAEHPTAPIVLRVGGGTQGLNPKVNNLRHMLRAARYEYLLISDADVRPGRHYLKVIAREATGSNAGLVHNLLVADGERRLGSLLESVQMNTWVASAVCGADQVGHSCVIGKSILMPRAVLERIGGFERVQDVLAEDYLLGKLVHDAGFPVRLSTYALPTTNPERKLAEFLNRHLRWAQMRRRIAPGTYVMELLANPIWCMVVCLGCGVFLLPTLAAIWQYELFALALVTLAVKCIGDELIARQVRRRGVGIRGLFLIPAKDLIVGALWVIGAVRRTVAWRGSYMLIGPESSLHPLPQTQVPHFAIEQQELVDEV